MILENLPTIPRIYTALAEWMACMAVLFPLLKQRFQWKFLFQIIGSLVIQILLQLIAGRLPNYAWVPGMIVNILWMYVTIYYLSHSNWQFTAFQCSKAFILAEFTASFCWQMYFQFFDHTTHILSRSFFLILTGFVIIYLIFILIEIRMARKEQQGEMVVRTKEALVSILTACIIFTFSNSGFWLAVPFLDLGGIIGIFSTRTFINLSGVCILYLQEIQMKEDELKQELLAINHVFQSQYQQYEAYKENNDLINRKIHDLKHQIDIIRSETDTDKREQYLMEMEEAIINHDSSVETGNPVLDTILTRKNIYCLEHEIKLTCLVDGKLMSFMHVMDLCSLFGNALDNAIESVEKLPNAEQRLIQLKVSAKNNFIFIRLENYVNDIVNMSEGLPETTKNDHSQHGYGLKSIAHVTKKYEGNMTLSNEKNWFVLRILFPKQL